MVAYLNDFILIKHAGKCLNRSEFVNTLIATNFKKLVCVKISIING